MSEKYISKKALCEAVKLLIINNPENALPYADCLAEIGKIPEIEIGEPTKATATAPADVKYVPCYRKKDADGNLYYHPVIDALPTMDSITSSKVVALDNLVDAQEKYCIYDGLVIVPIKDSIIDELNAKYAEYIGGIIEKLKELQSAAKTEIDIVDYFNKIIYDSEGAIGYAVNRDGDTILTPPEDGYVDDEADEYDDEDLDFDLDISAYLNKNEDEDSSSEEETTV